MYQLAEGMDYRKDFPVDFSCKGSLLYIQSGLRRCLRLYGGNPSVQNQCKRSALGPGLCGKVPDQFPVSRKALASCSLKPALRRKIGVRYDEIPLHHIIPYRLEEKTFSAPVAPDDKTERRASFGDDIHIMKQCVNLMLPADRHIGKPRSRHDAALQGIQDGLRNPARYLSARGCIVICIICHFCSPKTDRSVKRLFYLRNIPLRNAVVLSP